MLNELPNELQNELQVSALHPKGEFKIEHIRDGVVLSTQVFKNGIVNEGKDFLLDVFFNSVTPYTIWYLGLVDLVNYSPGIADDDTYDDLDQAGNGWDMFNDYTDPANGDSAVTRPIWTVGSASAQSITNAAVVTFDITGAGDVKGVFLCGGAQAATKTDHTGVTNKLWATALFASDVPVVLADQLKVTYTVSA